MNMVYPLLQRLIVIGSCLLIVLSSFLSACGATQVAISAPAPAVLIPEVEEGVEPVVAAPTASPVPSTPTSLPPTATTKPQASLNREEIMSSPDYGMQVFLYWKEEIADRDLKLVEEAGFRWIKQEIPWREIEGQGKGLWQWDIPDRMIDQIEAHNLKVIVRLGSQPEWAAAKVPFPEIGPPDKLQDFYDYVFAVASRYKGRVEAYQVWNEPNLAREWGGRPPNPAEYTEMLKAGYQAVKAADPEAVVISAGMAPTTRNDDQAMPDIYFLQGMYEAEAGPYFDALGVHASGFKSPPEIDPAEVAADPELSNHDSAPEELRRVYAFRRVEDLRDLMVRHGDEAKKVVVLEMGWTIDNRPGSPYRWHAVTEQQQDKYLQRAYAYAAEHWQPWIGVMSLIYIADPKWTLEDEQTYWSIVYPGYPALRTSMAYYGVYYMDKVPPVETPQEGPQPGEK